MFQSGLRGSVMENHWCGFVSEGAGNVDNGTLSHLYVEKRRLAQEGWAYTVRRKKGGHRLLIHIVKWTLSECAGVVDQDVQSAEALYCLGHGSLHRIDGARIGADRLRLEPVRRSLVISDDGDPLMVGGGLLLSVFHAVLLSFRAVTGHVVV